MFKWGLIALGIVFLWGGIDNHVNYGSALNETAEQTSVGKLGALIAKDEPRFVHFSADLQDATRIYPSYIERPKFTGFSPTEVSTVRLKDLRGKTLKPYLGSVVELALSLEGLQIELQTIREQGDERTLLGSMIMAPLRGTASRVWALSPTFGDYDDDAKARWLHKSAYTGRLSFLRDLNVNVASLEHEVEEVVRLANKESRNGVPADALVLLGHRPQMSAADEQKIDYYLPVGGSDNRVFIKTNPLKEEAMRSAGGVTGILRAENSRFFSGVETILGGTKLPSRIGIVSLETADDVNTEHTNTTLIGVIGGLLMMGLGSLLVRRSGRQ